MSNVQSPEEQLKNAIESSLTRFNRTLTNLCDPYDRLREDYNIVRASFIQMINFLAQERQQRDQKMQELTKRIEELSKTVTEQASKLKNITDHKTPPKPEAKAT